MSSSTSPTKVPPMKPPRLQKSLSMSYDSHSSSIPVLPPQGSPTHSTNKHSPQQGGSPVIVSSHNSSQGSNHSGSPALFHSKLSPDSSPASIHSKHSLQSSPASKHSVQGSPALLHSKSSPEDSPALQNKRYSPKSSPIPVPKQDHETAKKSLVAALAMAGAKQRSQSSPKPLLPPDPAHSSGLHIHQNGGVPVGEPTFDPKGSRPTLPQKPNPPPVCVKPPTEQENTKPKTPPQQTKKPLLPPVDPPMYKNRTISQPAPPTSSSNHLSPSPTTQKKRFMNRSESSDDRSPTKSKPRAKSHDDHVIAPEDIPKVPVVVDIGSSVSSDPFEEEEDSGVTHGNIILPVSPTSTTSDAPDESIPGDVSPVFMEGKDSEPPPVGTVETSKPHVETSVPVEKDEETDGGKVKPTSAAVTSSKPRVTKPAAGKGTRSKTSLKDDTSWIKSKKDDTTTPTAPTAQATPISATPTTTATNTTSTSSNKKKVTPYRSIAILPDKPSSISASELLQDTSKPLIGPSGQYYPPAVRTRTPEPQTHQNTTSGLGMRKVKSNDKVLSTTVEGKGTTTTTPSSNDDELFKQKNDIPKRFKMTRRSSSFTDKKTRPVSMMDDVVRMEWVWLLVGTIVSTWCG